jgi:hypothetical protein
MVIYVNVNNYVKRKEMIMAGRVKVVRESNSGRNLMFQDTKTKGMRGEMTRSQFVQRIEAGRYPHYHVRRVNGVKTPVSNPDNTSRNNLN